VGPFHVWALYASRGDLKIAQEALQGQGDLKILILIMGFLPVILIVSSPFLVDLLFRLISRIAHTEI